MLKCRRNYFYSIQFQVKEEEELSRRESIAAEEDPLGERGTPSYNHAAAHSHNGAATNLVCATAVQQRDSLHALAGYPGLGGGQLQQQMQQQQQHHHHQQGYPQLVGHHHPLNPIFHQIQTNWSAMYSHIQQPPQ